jgi:hypothetical protein
MHIPVPRPILGSNAQKGVATVDQHGEGVPGMNPVKGFVDQCDIAQMPPSGDQQTHGNLRPFAAARKPSGRAQLPVTAQERGELGIGTGRGSARLRRGPGRQAISPDQSPTRGGGLPAAEQMPGPGAPLPAGEDGRVAGRCAKRPIECEIGEGQGHCLPP